MHHCIAGAMMRRAQDAIHHRIAQVDVRRGHVDLGAQRAAAVGKLARAHALEQIEILFDRAVAIRAVLARLGQRAAVFAHLVGVQIADVRLARLDQLDRPLIELLEIIRSVEHPVLPIEAQPAHVLLDRIDVFDLFLGRIGVVEAQVALAPELRREAEIEADRFGVADVQIAVGLRRKARVHPLLVLALPADPPRQYCG